VLCLHVTTTPPQPGASGSASLTGPSGPQTTGFVLDGSGAASVGFPIGVLGPYGAVARVGASSGFTTVPVGAAQGTCPTPSSPCAGTPGLCTDGCGPGTVCCPLLGPGVCACEPERLIDVIVVGGLCLPRDQLVSVTGPECTGGGVELPHWHARQGFAIATDGTVVLDTEDCGYALVDETPVERVEHCAVCD
jgi:hypothetical protein